MPAGTLVQQLERARDLGFLGPVAISTQLGHAQALLSAASVRCGPGLSLLDLGSGGGLPGLAAVAEPQFSKIVLLDRSERRCAFLRSALAVLPSTADAVVYAGLAEDAGRDTSLREGFDVVTSRSFGPPAATLECAAPFLRVGGLLVVSDPPNGRVWPVDGVAMFQLEIMDRSCVEPSWTLFCKVGRLGARFPRRAGVPSRRPMFHV